MDNSNHRRAKKNIYFKYTETAYIAFTFAQTAALCTTRNHLFNKDHWTTVHDKVLEEHVGGFTLTQFDVETKGQI